MNGLQVKGMVLDLLLGETERDKQHKVGASQIANPCDKHLAKALAGHREAPSKYWLGAKLGTATHLLLEDGIKRANLPELEDSRIEEKIILGELEGYGTIKSTPDLAVVKHNHLLDWKTTKRDKSKKLQNLIAGKQDAESYYTLSKYIGQTQLYAWGLNQMGITIDGISLVFINRDGTNEGDIWEHTFPYDESIALGLWERLQWLWQELQDGNHPDNFMGDSHCFNCATA